MKEASRVQMIDVLRGLAAIAVALFHFNEPYPALPDAYHRLVKFGWLGVPVFFVISGFCVAAARERSTTVSFFFRRFARIYPPYWASVVVVLGVVALRLATSGKNDVTVLPHSAMDWLYTLLALTKPASGVQGLNWAYWSLGYELSFYIVLGLLSFGRAYAFILFSLLACFVPGFPFDQWGTFGLGLACYYSTTKRPRAALALAAVCIVQCFLKRSPAEGILGCLTALLIVFPPRLILHTAFRPLRAAGIFSYSLYLIHVPVACYLLAYYLPFRLSRELAPSLLQDAIYLSVCLVFAYVFHRVIERPSHELARRMKFPSPSRMAGPLPAQTAPASHP